MADRYTDAFGERLLLPDWLNEPENPFNQGSVDIINSGPPQAYTQIVRDAFLKMDKHVHSESLVEIDALDDQITDMETAVKTANNRKLPQGEAVTVKQAENVGFTITLRGTAMTGDNSVVTTVHAEAPSYIYYNDPTKKWVIAELSTAGGKDDELFTTIPAKTYTVVVFTLKKWG